MAGKGGGAWKVAYADFVTAMMAFFMVMWLTSQKQEVKEAIADHFKHPEASVFPYLKTQNKKGKSFHPPTKPSLRADEEDPEAKLPRVMTIREAQVPRAAAVVYFREDSAELEEASKQQLKRLIPWIAGKPQKLELRGHTTLRPLPSDSSFTNTWELSYARCLATMKHLETLGIPAERIRLSQAAGFEPGSIKPDEEAQAKNSRVEVFLLSEMARDLVGSPEEREARFETPVH